MYNDNHNDVYDDDNNNNNSNISNKNQLDMSLSNVKSVLWLELLRRRRKK